jgi:hypothetical protein
MPAVGRLNDLWAFDGDEWQWFSPDNNTDVTGVFVDRGELSTTSWPGARADHAAWVDDQQRVWVFGGEGFSEREFYDYLPDMWMFDASNASNPMWMWLGSENSTNVYAGTYTGSSFAPYDFSNGGADDTLHENLLVTVDEGTEQTITLTAHCGTPADAAAAITILGATVAVEGDVLVITSDTTGPLSRVAVSLDSGSNAWRCCRVGTGTGISRGGGPSGRSRHCYQQTAAAAAFGRWHGPHVQRSPAAAAAAPLCITWRRPVRCS